MTSKFDVQVKAGHYFSSLYDSPQRFISYFKQIEMVRALKPKRVLEIGPGNMTVSNYLKQSGIDLNTCDFDSELQPDFVADIRNLPFQNESYSVVVACEILEHLPWHDFDIAISELYRVSQEHVIISIPYSSANFEIVFEFPLIKRFFKRPFFNFSLSIPYFFRPAKFDGQHYWEMGRKGFSRHVIRQALEKHFLILDESSPVLNSCHRFFLLKKSFE